MNKKILIVLTVVVLIVGGFLLKRCGQQEAPPLPPTPISEVVTATETVVAPIPVSPKKVKALPKVVPAAKVESKTGTQPSVSVAAPKIQLHTELIPKNIEIVRVYYTASITGPGSSLDFDINGSGFNKEFEKMITVESGQSEASVQNLALITPNQIHGTLVISTNSKTRVAFPKILIQGKVVFQAPEPFAVIRPGEILSLVFTEMGESGRSGRFRVFTNLTQEMFSQFGIKTSTPTIQISDLTPSLPFVVDGTIIIGPAVGGEYGISITLKDNVIWNKPGIIRVVRPNVGQSGLIQKVVTQDGFHRPADKARFTIQGSGFLPADVDIVKASVKDLPAATSQITYGSPGRLELELTLPADAPVGSYGLIIKSGEEVLHDAPNTFRIVDKNWSRGLGTNPALVPGGSATLSLKGRDLTAEYVSKIKIEVDEPDLVVGAFTLVNSQQATAPISAGPKVAPGDYLLKMTSGGKPVSPEFGSIIQVLR